VTRITTQVLFATTGGQIHQRYPVCRGSAKATAGRCHIIAWCSFAHGQSRAPADSVSAALFTCLPLDDTLVRGLARKATLAYVASPARFIHMLDQAHAHGSVGRGWFEFE